MTGIGPRPPRELFQLDDFALGRPMRIGLTPYGPIPHDYNAFWFKWPLRIPASPCWAFDTTYPEIESKPESKTPTVPGTWPMGECFFNLATCPQLCEYTVNQSLLATALTYGSLLPPIEGESLRGWQRWKRIHFSVQEVLDGKAAPQATPANDGVPNLLKYAMGLSHPKVPLQNPTIDVDEANGTLRLRVRNGLGELETFTFVPSRSGDFQWKQVERAVFMRLSTEPTTVRVPLSGQPN